MKFEAFRLLPAITKSIEKAGFKKPTDIQYKTIPAILSGEDVLAIAQTGTGKTAAFVLPVLHLLQKRRIDSRADGVKCIVMVPTHELAIQITEVFHQFGSYTSLVTTCIHGGVEQEPQIAKLEKGVDILVATPGRMFDLVSQGHLNLQRIQILILDEADRMLDLGFIKDIRDMMRFLPSRRQTLFFSATINPEIKNLAYSLVRNAIRIQISPKDPVSKNVTHSVTFIKMDDKRFFLERIVHDHPDSKILVFVRTKVRAERVMAAMERVEIKSVTIHGDKDQKERSLALKQFKTGEVKMLITTDVSARGIDIPDVDYVINYDLPDVAENYVHRVGRTGRGTKKGVAVSFCSEEEKPILEQIESFITKPIDVLELNKDEYLDILETTFEQSGNWRALMKEAEAYEEELRRNKKKKKK